MAAEHLPFFFSFFEFFCDQLRAQSCYWMGRLLDAYLALAGDSLLELGCLTSCLPNWGLLDAN
ncbi:hypothetical protein CD191_22135 [Paenibacillus odorifer]|uniref:Uncharacterized protein n=1 Tax=Paenibacillus odorifer TaxID=189426 RepID=A0AAD0P4B4_9BACL|nr:hypothetical protein CD191_22135 [Paenibacillus odorifer]